MSALFELAGVTKSYPSSGDAPPTEVLRGINLAVSPGESVAIVGPSGCGKSTLLNIIGTLDRPTSGSVLLEGRDLSRLDDAELAGVRSSQFGFIFQLHHLLPQCNVLENVLVPTLAAGVKQGPAEAEQRALDLLARLNLAHRLAYRPGQLSGGERQRVAVARALINQPKLLLADEPTGALDQASADNLAQILIDLNLEQQVTLIVITHSREVAARMGRVMELRDGKLTQSGAPA